MEFGRELRGGATQWMKSVKYTCEQQAELIVGCAGLPPLSWARIC